jgi:hypothetical protein
MKTLRTNGWVLAAFLIAGLVACKASADFIGGTVSADYHFPDLATVQYASGNAVVGAGVEFDNPGGFGVGISPSVDISATSILITYPAGYNLANPPGKTFDGFVITDTGGTIPDITGVSLASTNIPGYDGSQLSFDADHVYVNQLGFTHFDSGAFIEVNVTFADAVAAPLPSSVAMGMALVALAAIGRALNLRRCRAA